MQAVTKNILKFTATGLGEGLVLAGCCPWAQETILSRLVWQRSEFFVGAILGIVHRNDA